MTKEEKRERKIELGAEMLARTLESELVRKYLVYCGKTTNCDVDWPSTLTKGSRWANLNRYLEIIPQETRSWTICLAGCAVRGASGIDLYNYCLAGESRIGFPGTLLAISGQMSDGLVEQISDILEKDGGAGILNSLREKIASYEAVLGNQLHHAKNVRVMLESKPKEIEKALREVGRDPVFEAEAATARRLARMGLHS